MKLIGVIPARYASTRMPGKPLADILGKPMIWWVYQEAKKCKKLDDVFIATDDERIAEACRTYGMEYCMTSPDHDTPTGRIWEVSTKVEADLYLQIMGDEPLINVKAFDLILPDTLPEDPYYVAVLTDRIRFAEAVFPSDGKLLVGSFGSSELDPLNTEGKGYVLEFTDTVSRVLIPSDGNLSAPKGMLVKDSCLLIADVGKLAVYDLRDTAAAPQIVRFPDGELYVNDMALHGNMLYVTVTNTGSIYSLDVTRPYAIDTASLKPYVTIPGANGIAIRGDTMYVASYPPDGVTTPDNAIYCIENISAPVATKLFDRPGQYDGLALSADGSRLYFTNWVDSEVGYYDFADKQVHLLDPGVAIGGPARLSLDGDRLYVPDLPGSRVVILPL